jgi:hypothetical protein
MASPALLEEFKRRIRMQTCRPASEPPANGVLALLRRKLRLMTRCFARG